MLAQILTQIASVIGGGINSALGLVVSTMQSGFKTAIQFHKEGIAFARDVGLSAKQAQAYTDVLIQRTQVLANKYGVSAEAIMQVQRGLSEATGKQLMLNDAQAEGFVQIDKMMGAQARSKFTEEIMNGMGGQIDTVQNAMAKVYATAAKQGLTAKKLTDKVAQNLSMANRLSFRNGIDGITRMAALSEKLGFNMSSVESAAGQFMELDKAIENAAQMQMLGGSAAANFGNPLTAAYEANYDPEAFAQRMSDSLASYATFDASKGVASINGMNMDFVRNIAKTMGISTEEASRMAKKQAEVKYKENAFGTTLDNIAGGNEAKRNYILNNSQLNTETGRLEIQGKDISSITPEEWENMMHFDQLSDKEILAEQAQTLISIDEHITGAQAKVAASFAEGIDEFLPDIGLKIKELGNYISDYAKIWGADTGKVIGQAMTWLNENGDKIKTVADGILGGITKVFNFFSDHWEALIAAILGWKALKGILGTSLGGGTSVGGRAMQGIGRGIKSVGQSLWGGTKGMFLNNKAAYALNRGARSGRFMSMLKAPGQSFNALSAGAKAATIGGAALGVGIGAYKAFTADNNADRGEGIGTMAGTVIGTAIAGPLGAAVGGWLGGMGGKLIGEHWEDIKGFAKGAWEATKYFAKDVWEGIKNIASGVWETTKNIAKSVWDVIPPESQAAIKKVWDVAEGATKATWDVIKGAGLAVWDVIKGVGMAAWDVIKGASLAVWDVTKGAVLGAWSVIKGYVLGVWEAVKGAGLGIWEVIKGAGLGLWEGLKGMWAGLWDIINAPFKAISDTWNGIKEGFGQILDGNILDGILTMLGGLGKGILDIITAPFKAFGDVLGGLGKGLLKFGSGVIKGVGEFAKGIWNGIGQFVNGILNGIGEFAKGIWSAIGDVASGVWNAIADVASGVWNAIGDFASGIWTGIGDLANGIWNGFTELGGGAWGAIKDKAGEIWGSIGDAASAVWNGIGDVASKVWNGIGDYASSIWDGIKGFAKDAWNGIEHLGLSVWYGFLKLLNKTHLFSFDIPEEYHAEGGFINQGASGVEQPIPYAQKGEVVLNPTQQKNFMALANDSTVRAKEYGAEREYIYKPNGSETSNVNGNTITVKDFNINLSGTLKLEGGNASKNIDMNALLNDYQFMNALKEMIKQSINTDMNGGRFMNDLATLRGQVSSSSIIGR